MKVAIIGSFHCHLECIVYLLEILKDNEIHIYIDKDIYKWINYCSKFYNFKVFYNSISKEIINIYDNIIKLSSNDPCLENKKIISLCHLKEPVYYDNVISKNFLSLSPYISGHNIFYTFPIFKPPNLINSINNKIVTFIGYYKADNFDQDTINFFKINSNYEFYLLIWNLKYEECTQLHELKNIHFYSNIYTESMLDLINKSKFILSKKYINYDRFSGQLGLAMSFEKPIIIDVKTKNNYGLPGIPFKQYSDVGNLDNISDEKYNSIKSDIRNFNKNNLDKNKKIFNSLLN